MRVIKTTVYNYSELTAEAQAKARDWYREVSAADPFFAKYVLEDFREIATACGFSFPSERGIYWSVGGGRDDGASFEAPWSAGWVDIAQVLASRPASYRDANGVQQASVANARLHLILEHFAQLAEVDGAAYGSVRVARNSHTLVPVYATDAAALPELSVAGHFEAGCRDLAAYLFARLQEAYADSQSDEQVAEAIEANEYEFLVDGRRA